MRQAWNSVRQSDVAILVVSPHQSPNADFEKPRADVNELSTEARIPVLRGTFTAPFPVS
jgi:hypothetical protein